jgi:hypothetical protein
MTAEYSKTSPYYKTKMFGQFLDVLNYREIPKLASDAEYKIGVVYKYRPDMLAHDLYGSSSLWWVFAVRNPNVIKDPIFDFFPGQTIYLPTKTTLTTFLGL